MQSKQLFSYYTAKGQQIGNISNDSTLFHSLVVQLSNTNLNTSNPGGIMTADNFSQVWDNGKGFTVDTSTNTITNIGSRGDNSAVIKVATDAATAFTSTKLDDATSIRQYFTNPAKVTLDDAETIAAQYSSLPASMKLSGGAGQPYALEDMITAAWNDSKGLVINTDALKSLIDANVGKLYQAKNGKIYMIEGQEGMNVHLQDIVSGDDVVFNNTGGGSHVGSTPLS